MKNLNDKPIWKGSSMGPLKLVAPPRKELERGPRNKSPRPKDNPRAILLLLRRPLECPPKAGPRLADLVITTRRDSVVIRIGSSKNEYNS
jgi:hypothetical protein